MRFTPDGPNLPDDLLAARDDGRVLFFCGSGVSKEKANLPDFFGLAGRVLTALRALPDSAPQELMALAEEFKKRSISGVGSILAADRLFGLLERDFEPADIDAAVGKVLEPAADVDLSAHRTLLDLSRTPNGTYQLVTTNFELLFEKVRPNLTIWTPDRLPDLRREQGFDGIVHLHGMFEENYRAPSGGRLVLSSAEFGRAYLAEGWATRFIQDAIERYAIVFVGYTADDPPVQYLLEALNRKADKPKHGLYAFQPGSDSEAAALWEHKGVTALAYPAKDHDHSTLWNTLEGWAARARNPEKWRQGVLRRAAKGPEKLQPYERGQVMHLAMTEAGVKTIAIAKKPLPASWLRTLDPNERYATPGRTDIYGKKPKSDPFELYGLDSDPVPTPDLENSTFQDRKVPKDALNALAATASDTPVGEAAPLVGEAATRFASLPKRLLALTEWLTNVADQPTAIWWACGQGTMHPRLIAALEQRANYRRERLSPAWESAWRYFTQAYKPATVTHFQNAHSILGRIERGGWDASVRRTLEDVLVPRIKVTRPIGKGPVEKASSAKLWDLISIDVGYYDEALTIPIPDDQVSEVTPLARRHLEVAALMEAETSPFSLNHIPPIHEDPDIEGETYERDRDFNAHIFWYVGLLNRLRLQNPQLARAEVAAWQSQNNILFNRLKIWAAGIPDLLDADSAATLLLKLPEEEFWSSRGQRDLLLTLKARWREFDGDARESLERRLMAGPDPLSHISRTLSNRWQDFAVLARITWLQREGCEFRLDVGPALARALKRSPDWRPEYADRAAESHEGRGGTVETDPSFDQVADLPINELLPRALELSNRDHSRMRQADPLAGLFDKRPTRVLRALHLDGLKPDQRQWIWTRFLQASPRREDGPQLAWLIAARLARLPEPQLLSILRAAIYWLEFASEKIYPTDRELVQTLVRRFTLAISQDPTLASPEPLPSGKERDWLTTAFNSTAGELAHIVIRDPLLAKVDVGTMLPQDWKDQFEPLLALPQDHGLFALVRAGQAVGWFFERDKDWTEARILSALTDGGLRREVFLTALLFRTSIGSRDLFRRLTPAVLGLVDGSIPRPKVDIRALSSFLIAGWNETVPSRWVEDAEMRTALVRGRTEFRTTVLWHVTQWPLAQKLAFLKDVWPLQRAAKSGIVTDRLCDLVFKDPANFVELAATVLPLLSRLEGSGYLFITTVRQADDIMAQHPRTVLDIFWRILPPDGGKWPYGTHDAIDRLAQSKAVQSDPRMIELMKLRHAAYA